MTEAILKHFCHIHNNKESMCSDCINDYYISKEKVKEAWSDYIAKKITMKEFAERLRL